MAMTFSSAGCRAAAAGRQKGRTESVKSSSTLDQILNSELTGIISKVKTIYESETANELYAAYDKMKAKFPDFINAIKECSTYLSETVAPAYEKVESTAAQKIG